MEGEAGTGGGEEGLSCTTLSFPPWGYSTEPLRHTPGEAGINQLPAR